MSCGTGKWAKNIIPSNNTSQHLLASYCMPGARLIHDLPESSNHPVKYVLLLSPFNR